MQRIINDPDNVVEEMLQGFLKNHSEIVTGTDNSRVVKYKQAPTSGKVGIVTGGGSGHKPAFVGYVGKNMVDAAAVGEIFSSPTAKSFYDAFKEADGGAGIACLYGNYAGDNMNVKMAVKMAKKQLLQMMMSHLRLKTNQKNAAASQAKSSCGKLAGLQRQKVIRWMRSYAWLKKQLIIQKV